MRVISFKVTYLRQYESRRIGVGLISELKFGRNCWNALFRIKMEPLNISGKYAILYSLITIRVQMLPIGNSTFYDRDTLLEETAE